MNYLKWLSAMIAMALFGWFLAHFGIGEFEMNFVGGVASLALLESYSE